MEEENLAKTKVQEDCFEEEYLNEKEKEEKMNKKTKEQLYTNIQQIQQQTSQQQSVSWMVMLCKNNRELAFAVLYSMTFINYEILPFPSSKSRLVLHDVIKCCKKNVEITFKTKTRTRTNTKKYIYQQ